MFFSTRVVLTGLCAAAMALLADAQESHTISFTNNCGYGTPILRDQNGNTLSTGGTVTISGPFPGGISYLQTGNCGADGENCIIVETSLINGAGTTSTDLSLIPPHAFSVTTGFGYYNGCDGEGADCTSASCTTAFHQPGDTGVQRGCSASNVDLAITFCD